MKFFLLSILALSYTLLSPALPEDLPPGILARGGGIEITKTEFLDYVASLYLNDAVGKSLLEQLIREEAIEAEAARRSLTVSKELLQGRVDALDEQFREESEGKRGLNAYLEEQEIDEDVFFRALRLSIAHEIMAREDFELDADETLPVEKLNIWLKDLLNRIDVRSDPSVPGIVATVGARQITSDYFASRLLSFLGRSKRSDLLSEKIGIRLINARARDLDISLTEEDADREIRDRQARLAAMDGLKGITYEQYLQASKGISVDALKRSEKFRGEVLLKKICETLHHESYLQDFYEANRDFFNRRFGRAARLSTIFLKAVKFPNQFVARRFEEAREELKAIRTRLERGEVVFEEMARIYSEHDSKSAGGDIGFVSAGTPGWQEIVEAALKAEPGTVLGPFDTAEGSQLIKVCGHRDDPTYEAIHDEVVQEARQRFYRQMLEEADVVRKY